MTIEKPLSAAIKIVRAFSAVVFCLALCGAIFAAIILVWSLVATPFVNLPSGSPVVIGAFLGASAVTVFIWKTLTRRKNRILRKK